MMSREQEVFLHSFDLLKLVSSNSIKPKVFNLESGVLKQHVRSSHRAGVS